MTLQQIAAEQKAAKQQAEARQQQGQRDRDAQTEYLAAWNQLGLAARLQWSAVKAGKAVLDLATKLEQRELTTRLEEIAEGWASRPEEVYIVELLLKACREKPTAAALGRELNTAREWAADSRLGLSEGADNLRLAVLQGWAPPPRPHPEPARQAAAASGRGVAPRDRWFLEQHEARGTDTYRKPKRIQEKWWAMKDEARAAICPDRPGKVTRDVVVTGIKRARAARGDKPSRTPAKRKRAARKA